MALICSLRVFYKTNLAVSLKAWKQKKTFQTDKRSLNEEKKSVKDCWEEKNTEKEKIFFAFLAVQTKNVVLITVQRNII